MSVLYKSFPIGGFYLILSNGKNALRPMAGGGESATACVAPHHMNVDKKTPGLRAGRICSGCRFVVVSGSPRLFPSRKQRHCQPRSTGQKYRSPRVSLDHVVGL